MGIAGIIQNTINSLLPQYAHDLLATKEVSLGGSQAVSNSTFTEAYDFVVPLCAVMGVFCVLLLVFVGVCIWAERTHDIPDDDASHKEEQVNVDSGEEGGQQGNRVVGGGDGEMEMTSRRPRRGGPPSRQQSGLFNMDPSFYKKTSSTAPSFRKPPNYNVNDGSGDMVMGMGGISKDQGTMRRRASQASARSQSPNGSFASPPTQIAQVAPHPNFGSQQQLYKQQQQQQRQLGSSATHHPQGRSSRGSFVASPNHHGAHPPYVNPLAQAGYDQLPPRPAPRQPSNPSSASDPSYPLDCEEQSQQQSLQQLLYPSSVNPLAPAVTASKRAPSMRNSSRQPSRNGSNYAQSRPQTAEEDEVKLELCQEDPHPQPQQQEPQQQLFQQQQELQQQQEPQQELQLLHEQEELQQHQQDLFPQQLPEMQAPHQDPYQQQQPEQQQQSMLNYDNMYGGYPGAAAADGGDGGYEYLAPTQNGWW